MIRIWLIRKLDNFIARMDAIAERHDPNRHDVHAAAKPQSVMSAKVIRKDGTVEDLGVISRSVLTKQGAKRLLNGGR